MIQYLLLMDSQSWTNSMYRFLSFSKFTMGEWMALIYLKNLLQFIVSGSETKDGVVFLCIIVAEVIQGNCSVLYSTGCHSFSIWEKLSYKACGKNRVAPALSNSGISGNSVCYDTVSNAPNYKRWIKLL